jgi:hypothetical protein
VPEDRHRQEHVVGDAPVIGDPVESGLFHSTIVLLWSCRPNDWSHLFLGGALARLSGIEWTPLLAFRFICAPLYLAKPNRS